MQLYKINVRSFATLRVYMLSAQEDDKVQFVLSVNWVELPS